MPRTRPTVVTVFAILNLVFGGLGFVCLLCGGVAIGVGAAALSNMPPPAPGQPAPPNIRFPPAFTNYMIVAIPLGIVLSIMLIASGIGLLKLRPWGRHLAITYGVLGILLAVGGTVYQYTVLQPAMEKWAQDLQQQAAQQAARNAPPGGPAFAPTPIPTASPVQNAVSGVISALISMVYAVALLVVMFLPQVRDAFSGRPVRRRVAEEEDYYDEPAEEDRPRRRRFEDEDE